MLVTPQQAQGKQTPPTRQERREIKPRRRKKVIEIKPRRPAKRSSQSNLAGTQKGHGTQTSPHSKKVMEKKHRRRVKNLEIVNISDVQTSQLQLPLWIPNAVLYLKKTQLNTINRL